MMVWTESDVRVKFTYFSFPSYSKMRINIDITVAMKCQRE